MALMKKAKPADAVSEPALEPDVSEDVTAAPDEPAEAGDAATMAALAAAPAEATPTDAPRGDGLLDMFTTVGVQTVDRSMLLSLTQEVDMTDLVSELNVVAAALGIVRAQREAAETESAEAMAA